MSDSQPLDRRELTLKQLTRHEKPPTPILACVASPSPAKARRRPATERPSLPTANVAPVKLPSELFAIATSRKSQGDIALSKALDGIQAAATRLETERTKLVIQSQELQIWDMAREEELVLLRAENEQLEQQLAGVSEKVGKGLGRDGVLESLQFALRKARMERDAEMQAADALFNQLQEAKAAAMEAQQLRGAISAALGGLRDDWSAIPMLSEEVRQLRARADTAVQDPTNLSHAEIATLLGGLVALASRGADLQHEAQTLRGEKLALQQALDAAHQQLSEQPELLACQAEATAWVARKSAPEAEADMGRWRGSTSDLVKPSGEARDQLANEHGGEQSQSQLVGVLQQQVSELQTKLAEYRSYLEENQEEIARMQAELKRLRQRQGTQGQAGQDTDAQPLVSHLHSAAPRGHHHHHRVQHQVGPAPSGRGGGGSSSSAGGGGFMRDTQPSSASSKPACQYQQPQQQEQLLPKRPSAARQQPQQQQAVGTPTRHVPLSSSPISTVNYGGSPSAAPSPPIRGSPVSQQVAADFAFKVGELQALLVRAQQESAERESELLRQHEAEVEALRQRLERRKEVELAELGEQLVQQHAASLAKAAGREAELTLQHSRALADLEAQVIAKLSAQHAAALSLLHAQMAQLTGQHELALAEREAAAASQLQQREAELLRQHADALAALASKAEVRLAEALATQFAELAQRHAQERREAEDRLGAQAAAQLLELEAQLERRFNEQQAAHDAEARRKHAERLAEQATQLAQLHAEQAAQLSMQHAEAIAEREAQLLDQFERQLVERERPLAKAHADQLRDLEVRFAALAAEAADAREAQLRELFTEQLAAALRQQQESLAAAQVAAEAEVARLKEAEAVSSAAVIAAVERARLAELAARQIGEEVRRREAAELAVRQAEEQRPMEGGLEQQAAVAESSSQELEIARTATCTVSGDATSLEVPGPDQVDDGAAAFAQVRRLMEENEQLQRHVEELKAICDEAEGRRVQAVAEVERQYVEVVARLGREHEQATAEARAAHQRREANLRQMLARRTQEADQRHNEQHRNLQDQLVELRNLLMEERQRHSSGGNGSAAMEERAACLMAEQDEPGARRALAASRRRMDSVDGSSPKAASLSREQLEREERHAAPEPTDWCTAPSRASPGEAPFPLPSTVSFTFACGAQPLTAPKEEVATSAMITDVWSDGQVLLWPVAPSVPAATSASGGGTSTATIVTTVVAGGGGVDAGVISSSSSDSVAPATALAWALGADSKRPRDVAVRPLQRRITEEEDKAGGRSEPDLASKLVRVLRELESVAAAAATIGGSEARVSGGRSSLEVDVKRAAARQELLGASDADGMAAAAKHQPAVVERGELASVAAAASEGATQAAGRVEEAFLRAGGGGVQTRCTAAGRDDLSVKSTLGAGTTSTFGGEVRQGGADGVEDWGDLVSAPAPWPGAGGVVKAGGVTRAPAAAAGSGGGGPGYVSEDAASVSTDTEYNSDTEFYVDDEDDSEQRGRVLAAALAQSLRTSQVAAPMQSPRTSEVAVPTTRLLPPLLQDLQHERQAQSVVGTAQELGPSVAAGGVRSNGLAGRRRTGTDGGRTPAPSLVGRIDEEEEMAALKGFCTEGAEANLNFRADSAGHDLNATFWGVFPVLDSKVLAVAEPVTEGVVAPSASLLPSVAAAAAAAGTAAVDLEATLSGPFPVLPVLGLLPPDAHHGHDHDHDHHHNQALLLAEPAAAVMAAFPAREVSPSGHHKDASSCGVAPRLAGPPTATTAPFSFPEPPRTAAAAPEWDGAPLAGGENQSPTAAAVAAGRQEDGPCRPGDRVQQQQEEPIDLTGSFEFSCGGAVMAVSLGGSSLGPQLPHPAQQEERHGPVPDAATAAPFGIAEGQELGVVDELAVEPPGKAKGQQAVAGTSVCSDRDGDGRGGRGLNSVASPTGCSLPPLPRPRTAVRIPEWQVWVDLTDDGDDDSSNDAATAGEGPVGRDNEDGVDDEDEGDTGVDDAKQDADAEASAAGAQASGAAAAAAVTAFGSGAEDEDRRGSWPAPPAAARSAAGIRPLLLPNPLYSEAIEVSPAWNTADWNAGGGGSPQDHAPFKDEDGSLPSTPRSKSRGSDRDDSSGSTTSNSSSSSDDKDDDGDHHHHHENDDGDDGIAERPEGSNTAGTRRSTLCYGAWNALYAAREERPWTAVVVDPDGSGRHAAAREESVHLRSPASGGARGSSWSVGTSPDPSRSHSRSRSRRGPPEERRLGPAEQEEEEEKAAEREAQVMARRHRRGEGGGRPGGGLGHDVGACTVPKAGEAVEEEEETTGREKGDEGEQAGGGRSPVEVEDDLDDDLRSLIAAGATLSSSEKRRRRQWQRPLRGDTAHSVEKLEHPINLLRQGWEFSGGVASPISPRTAPRESTASPRLESSPLRHATAQAEAADGGPSIEERQQQRRQHQRPEGRQEDRLLMLPLSALPQRGRSSPPSSSSPAAVRRGAIPGSSQRTSPLSRSPTSSLGALGRRGGGGGRPCTAVGGACQAEMDHSVVAALPGASSVTRGSPPASTASGHSLSPMEARQLSRVLLGRARSRVSELEDQCRALTSSFHSVAAAAAADGGGAAAADAPAVEALPPHGGDATTATGAAATASPQLTMPHVNEELGAGPGREIVPLGDLHGGRGCRIAPLVVAPPSPLQPPLVAPAEVVDALDDLRCDLNELEALHRLTLRAARGAGGANGVPRGSVPALTTPPWRPLLLAGQAGRGAAALAAVASATERPQRGAGEADDERAGQAAAQQEGLSDGEAGEGAAGRAPASVSAPVSALTSRPVVDGFLARAAHRMPSCGMAHHRAWEPGSASPQPAQMASLQAEVSTRLPPTTAAAAATSGHAAAAVVASQRSGGGTWHGSGPAGTTVQALLSSQEPPPHSSPLGPPGIGMSSLDPALVAMLQLSIQAQVQGQLGQLEAKIAELQRQNEVLLAAATAASTPATPQPLPLQHVGPRGGSTAVPVTPLPLTPVSAAVCAADGGNGSGRGGGVTRRAGGGGVPEQPAALSWSRSGGGSLEESLVLGGLGHAGVGGGGSVDRMGPLREAWAMFPAVWELTPSPTPPGNTARGATTQGYTPVGMFPTPTTTTAAAAIRTAFPPAATPVLTSPYSGSQASAWMDVLAGPYSPEELSQLPPGIQLFAPPQLRAAALAAARDQALAYRHSL